MEVSADFVDLTFLTSVICSCYVLILTGITRCDMIAESIIAAAAEIGPLKVPIVVRLQGTNSEAGLKLVSSALH